MQVLGCAPGARSRRRWDAKAKSSTPGARPSPSRPYPAKEQRLEVGPAGGQTPWGGTGRGRQGDTASLKPGRWRGAHPSGAGSHSAPAIPSGRGLRFASAWAQVSPEQGPQGAASPPSMGVPRRAGDPAELRKSLKPLLEKRRRARINASLRQLKGLILPLLGREVRAGALRGLGGTSGAQIEQAGWAEGPLRKEPARGLCAAPEAEAAWGWHEEPLHPGHGSPTPRQESGAHGSLLEICLVCPSWPGAELPLLEAGEGGHPGNDRALPAGAACVLPRGPPAGALGRLRRGLPRLPGTPGPRAARLPRPGARDCSLLLVRTDSWKPLVLQTAFPCA
uniref:transcription factor HES-2 isoform X2 n=1 Tax=Nyctereutes procyonoides TaxID=34880 RepID=UPI002443A8AC|nr:transcription factor HES-2 isoform X2 [Nyctereutes procyonoides]